MLMVLSQYGPYFSCGSITGFIFLIVINEGLILVKECCSLFGPDYDNKDFFIGNLEFIIIIHSN